MDNQFIEIKKRLWMSKKSKRNLIEALDPLYRVIGTIKICNIDDIEKNKIIEQCKESLNLQIILLTSA